MVPHCYLDRLATGESELLANDILGRRLVAHDGHNTWGAYKGAAVSTSVGQLGNLEGTQCKNVHEERAFSDQFVP